MKFKNYFDNIVISGVVIGTIILSIIVIIFSAATGSGIRVIQETEVTTEDNTLVISEIVEATDTIIDTETTVIETNEIVTTEDITEEATEEATEEQITYIEPIYEEYIEYQATEVVPESVEEPVEEPVEYCSNGLPEDIDAVLRETCNERSVPYEVMLAIIYTESGFNPYAVNSSSGCFGYCQLHPLYYDSSMSPADNIRCGVNLLGDNLEKYGDIWAAITAYAVGHDNGSRSYANLIIQRARGYGYEI